MSHRAILILVTLLVSPTAFAQRGPHHNRQGAIQYRHGSPIVHRAPVQVIGGTVQLTREDDGELYLRFEEPNLEAPVQRPGRRIGNGQALHRRLQRLATRIQAGAQDGSLTHRELRRLRRQLRRVRRQVRRATWDGAVYPAERRHVARIMNRLSGRILRLRNNRRIARWLRPIPRRRAAQVVYSY